MMAIVVAPGQAVAQPDWDALAAQHGGTKSTTKLAPSEAQIKDAGLGGDDDPAFQQRPIYRYYFNDGTYVDARTAPNGADYSVIDYKPSSQYKPTKTTRTPEQQRSDAATATENETKAQEATRIRNESQWNADPANRSAGGSGRYEDHATRDARLAKEAADAETKGRQATLDADAKAERERVAARQAAQDARDAAEKNRPTVKIEDDGQGGLVAISVDPNTGKPTSVPVPGVKGKPQQVTVAGVVYEKGPDGTYKPLAGLPTGALPAGAPRPSGVLGDAAKDMDDFMAWLDPQVRSGAMTQAQADQHVKSRQAYWDTTIKEQEAVVGAQGQSFRDQSAQRRDTLADLSNRRTSATSIANQASGDLMPQIGNFGPGGGGASLAAAIRGSRVNAQDFATLTGANREVAPVQQGAAVQAVNAMPLPGGTAMAPGFDPRGTVAAPAPTGAVVPPAAAAATPVAPIFRPPPPVAGSVTPAPAAGPPVRDDWRASPGAAPQSMMPAPPPGFLSASRAQPQAPYDPTGTIQAMIADPSIDNQMLRAAVAAEYPGYDVDALLASAA